VQICVLVGEVATQLSRTRGGLLELYNDVHSDWLQTLFAIKFTTTTDYNDP
jgi:hypothetical protein